MLLFLLFVLCIGRDFLVHVYLQAEEEVLEEARKEEDLKRKWAATRDNRVGDWKEFKVRVISSGAGVIYQVGRELCIKWGGSYVYWKRESNPLLQDGVQTKKVKVGNFVPVTHQKEQRTTKDKSCLKKPMGIDDSYKQNWR